jgi:hypothetical protein
VQFLQRRWILYLIGGVIVAQRAEPIRVFRFPHRGVFLLYWLPPNFRHSNLPDSDPFVAGLPEKDRQLLVRHQV